MICLDFNNGIAINIVLLTCLTLATMVIVGLIIGCIERRLKKKRKVKK